MAFEWMETTNAGPDQRSSQAKKEALSSEIREKAGLFRRLGYAKAHAVHRCLGNIAWAYSESGRPPLSAAEVRKLVTEIYDR